MSILDQDTIDASGFQKAEDGSLVHGLVIFDHLKWRKRNEEKHGLQDQVKQYMIMIDFKYSPSLQGIALLKAMKMEAALENADLVF